MAYRSTAQRRAYVGTIKGTGRVRLTAYGFQMKIFLCSSSCFQGSSGRQGDTHAKTTDVGAWGEHGRHGYGRHGRKILTTPFS